MKQCASCAREIPDSATLCDSCRTWAVGVASAPTTPTVSSASDVTSELLPPPGASPSSQASAGAPAVGAGPQTRGAAANRRPLIILLCAVGGAGILTLALMSARGGASSEVAPARTAAPAAAPAAVARASAGSTFTQKWSGDNSAYWVGNRRKSAAFELPAEKTVQVWMRSVRPTLVVRCMAQSTQVFVVTESAMKIEPQTDDHTVTYSIDGEQSVSERWPDSDDHDALFAPDGAQFAQRLMHARTFRFGFTPHNASAVAADFNVNGLSALLEPIVKECGWKK